MCIDTTVFVSEAVQSSGLLRSILQESGCTSDGRRDEVMLQKVNEIPCYVLQIARKITANGGHSQGVRGKLLRVSYEILSDAGI